MMYFFCHEIFPPGLKNLNDNTNKLFSCHHKLDEVLAWEEKSVFDLHQLSTLADSEGHQTFPSS